MRVADLPGYARGLNEDEEYTALSVHALKDCDVILLVIQANDKAIADDQYMVECLYEWSKEGLLTNDGTYYGQDTGLEEDFTVKEDKTPEVEVKNDSVAADVEQVSPTPKVQERDYVKEIESICTEALNLLDKGSEQYKKIKEVFKLL